MMVEKHSMLATDNGISLVYESGLTLVLQMSSTGSWRMIVVDPSRESSVGAPVTSMVFNVSESRSARFTWTKLDDRGNIE
jgi:hypothetical protein